MAYWTKHQTSTSRDRQVYSQSSTSVFLIHGRLAWTRHMDPRKASECQAKSKSSTVHARKSQNQALLNARLPCTQLFSHLYVDSNMSAQS